MDIIAIITFEFPSK